MSKKPPEIERTPGGGLPRMTPAQRRRANALVRKTCCNYDNGNCLLLDDGEECVCPQTISYSVCCKFFRHVLLKDKEGKGLEAEVFQCDALKHCELCGKAFSSPSYRAKYCEGCKAKVQRRQKAEHARKKRAESRKIEVGKD